MSIEFVYLNSRTPAECYVSYVGDELPIRLKIVQSLVNQECAIIQSHWKASPKRPHSAVLSSKTCLSFANVGSKEAFALQLQPCNPAPLQRLNFWESRSCKPAPLQSGVHPHMRSACV